MYGRLDKHIACTFDVIWGVLQGAKLGDAFDILG